MGEDQPARATLGFPTGCKPVSVRVTECPACGHTMQWNPETVETLVPHTLDDGKSPQEGVPALVVASTTTIQDARGSNTSITISRSAEGAATTRPCLRRLRGLIPAPSPTTGVTRLSV